MSARIMLDMDGILADFTGGAFAAHGSRDLYEHGATAWDIVGLLNMTPEKFWAKCNEDFWATLPRTKEADAIVLEAERAVGRSNVGLLSTPCLTPGCCEGKLTWIKTNYPEFARSFVFTPRKDLAASRSAVLVDDGDHVAESFCAGGGQAVVYPRPWNANRAVPYPFAYFRTKLRQALATIH